MRKTAKQGSTSPETRLTRVLAALERELLDASDEEVMAAAAITKRPPPKLPK